MSKFGIFLCGFVLGICFLFILLTFNLTHIVIESDKKLEPEIELTTDGKTIDTLYIYKLKTE